MYDSALDAVRGEDAVARALDAEGSPGARPVEVLAAGKAAIAMLRPVAERWGQARHGTLVVTREREGEVPARSELHVAGHPIPDERSRRAGLAWLERAAACPPSRDLLVLLSGGASALLGCPVEAISIEALRHTTELLLRAGADIEAQNAVRKHLGRVGGGQSLRVAASERIEVLVLSDVAGDRLDVIASGPFCGDRHSYADALEALRERGLVDAVAASVRAHLEAGARGDRPETLKPNDPALDRVRHRVVANLDDALRGAETKARALGFRVRRWPRRLAAEAREEARDLLHAVRGTGSGTCWIAGGEPVVTVRGTGQGGRCQEFALAAAIELAGDSGVTVLAAATDGSDGPTDAAGAWADGGTCGRGRSAGRDPQKDLQHNDSHSFFAAEGGLLRTGATGTNVNDLFLVGTTETARSALGGGPASDKFPPQPDQSHGSRTGK